MNEVEPTLKDPVCGMAVTAQSPHALHHGGKPVFFCSAGCKAKFAAEPAKYLVAASGSAGKALDMTEPLAAGTVYTCPMHPEVRQDHPGNCPKCGMTLEPEMPNLDEREHGVARLPAALHLDVATDGRRHRARDGGPPPAMVRDGRAELD